MVPVINVGSGLLLLQRQAMQFSNLKARLDMCLIWRWDYSVTHAPTHLTTGRFTRVMYVTV